jgi:hypothetical protein
MAVRISSKSQFNGFKLGLISGPCKYDDGITVQLTNPSQEGVAQYACIQTERGDTIVPLIKHD